MRNNNCRYLGACLLLLSAQLTFAQITVRTAADAPPVKNPQPVIGRVLYDFFYIKDTSQRDYQYKEVFELNYSKTSSYFTSYTAKLNDTLMKSQLAAAFKNAPDPDRVDITLTTSAASSTNKFYTERTPRSMVYEIKALAGTPFILPSKQPAIAWDITDSTKSIHGFLCQKATGNSHGRKYTAWFCTDLPYHFGPRRLNGLPGLILEAYDDKQEVVYRLNRVEEGSVIPATIGLPANAETTTNAAFIRAEEAFKRNPQAFIDANRGKRTTTGRSSGLTGDFDPSKIKSITVKKNNTEPPTIKANNPIDLITD